MIPTPAAAVLLWPALWVYGFALAGAATLLDALAWPWLATRRRPDRPEDEAPPTLDASLIVLNYEGEHFLRELLPSLQATVAAAPGNHEILVVDNGSTDGSAALVRDEFPGIKLIALPENRFFIRGNRAGVEAAQGDVLVFVNNDMRVEPGFLSELLAGFGPPDVFAVTARIDMDGERVETGKTRAEFRRGAFHFVQSRADNDGIHAESTIPALWAGGGSSAFDRRKFTALGGFEDLYEPCYVEDLSLSYRAWRRGWRVLFAPAAGVHHVHQGTSRRVFGHTAVARLQRRNRELFFWRAVTAPHMVWSHALWLPWNALKDAKRKAAVGLGDQFRALLAAVPRMPLALKERQALRAQARRGDRETLRLASSVASHRRAATNRPIRILSLGTAGTTAAPGADVLLHQLDTPERSTPPVTDLLGVVPREFWGSVADATLRDAVIDRLREVDYDVIVWRDLHALAVAPTGLAAAPSILCLPPLAPPADAVERWRWQRFVLGLAGRVSAVACTADADVQRLAEWRPALPLHRVDDDGGPRLAELARLLSQEARGAL
ncbi:MAG: glycosyltransferase family 2 protein [Planctomycetota bacterium]